MNTLIVSKTILNTEVSKHFTQIINTNCFFRSNWITKIVLIATSTTSIIIIKIMNVIKQNINVFDKLSRCDIVKTFNWILSSSKNKSWNYYRVNDTIQMFKVHCDQNVSTRIKNLKLRNMQIISIKSFELCLIFCAIYNCQRFLKNSKWSDLCTSVSLMKKNATWSKSIMMIFLKKNLWLEIMRVQHFCNYWLRNQMIEILLIMSFRYRDV